MPKQGLTERLRQILVDTDESFYVLAARARVPRQSLTRFVAGERTISLETADRVAEALGLDLIKTRRPGRAPRGGPSFG